MSLLARSLSGAILMFVGLTALAVVGTGTVRAAPAEAEGGAWAQARARVPAGVAVFQPTWLPARLSRPPGAPDPRYWAGVTDPAYQVNYASADGSSFLRFSLGPVNSGPPNWSEPLSVASVAGRIYTTPAGWWPPIGADWRAMWKGKPLFYSIQGRGVSREELRRIVASLVPMGANAPPAQMPASGAGGSAITGGTAPALALLLAGAVLLCVRLASANREGEGPKGDNLGYLSPSRHWRRKCWPRVGAIGSALTNPAQCQTAPAPPRRASGQ